MGTSELKMNETHKNAFVGRKLCKKCRMKRILARPPDLGSKIWRRREMKRDSLGLPQLEQILSSRK